MTENTSPKYSAIRYYFLYLTVFTIGLLAIYYFFRNSMPMSAMYVIPVFYLVTAVSHLLLKQSLIGAGRSFLMNFLLGMTIKMFAYLVFLAVMMMGLKETSVMFIATFFICYVLFTGFELMMLRPLMKR
ncbi:MAG: hypothetical protein LC101_01165 [Flavobacteriales bacterium]|nr:hypothetical protein [Flavobacteriales bacterium]